MIHRQKSSESGYNYFLKDHLGSTRMVLGPDNLGEYKVKQALMYQAYGTVSPVEVMVDGSTDPLREKFTGKEFDEEGDGNGASGIQAYHFGFRVYDPEVGVWLSPDPLDQYWNAYSYFGEDPVNYVDRNGLSSTSQYDSYYIDPETGEMERYRPALTQLACIKVLRKQDQMHLIFMLNDI